MKNSYGGMNFYFKRKDAVETDCSREKENGKQIYFK